VADVNVGQQYADTELGGEEAGALTELERWLARP
jgi:hypothetical protein